MNPLALITGNPLYLGIAALIIFALGAASGATVNGWRLGIQLEECNGRVGALTTQVKILGEKIGTQNDSITATAAGGQAAAKAAEELLKAARGLTAANAGALSRLEQRIAQAAPKRPDGTAKDCSDARREIRSSREEGKP